MKTKIIRETQKMTLLNPLAVIGSNNPPEPTPFQECKREIEDLYEEAKHWLDSDPITKQIEADAINTLLNRIRDARQKADKTRKKELEPHKAICDQIQAEFNTLIGDTKSVTGLAIMAERAAKKKLEPWLLEIERQKQEEKRLAIEAERAAREAALEAVANRDQSDLTSLEEAERLIREAKQARDAAHKVDKSKAHAKGQGRATGLRSTWKATMVNTYDASAWVWRERNAELLAFVQEQADKAVRAGVRKIDGFEIEEVRVI